MIGAVVGVRAQGSPRPPAPEIAARTGPAARARGLVPAAPEWARADRAQADSVALGSHGARRGDCVAPGSHYASRTDAIPGVRLLVWWHLGAPGRWSGVRGRAHQEGYSAGSWRRSPAWTTYVPLDHLRAVGPLKCGWTTWFTKYGGPTARRWSKRAGRVTTCETPSHHAGRAVGAERERGRRNRPAARAAPDDRPADPAAPDSPRRARRRPGRAITTGPAPQRP